MWGEGMQPDERRARRIGERWNWRNEAMESQAAPSWKLQHTKATSGGGPVLWPGMEGLGMHKLAGSGRHQTTQVQAPMGGRPARVFVKQNSRAQGVITLLVAGRQGGPSVTIHDDLE